MSRRIVSVVPSTTLTLCDLGLLGELVGVTAFCADPPGLHRTCSLIGGTKDPDVAAIKGLSPTHVFLNHEENRAQDIAEIAAFAPVHLSCPRDPWDVASFLEGIPPFLGAGEQLCLRAKAMATAIAEFLTCAPAGSAGRDRSPTFLYFIWNDPLMVAGPDTYISRLLSAFGLHNLAQPGHGESGRYPAIDIEAVRRTDPDLLLFATEPFPFRRRQVATVQESIGTCHGQAFIVDGQLMSWHGSKTLEALHRLDDWRRTGFSPDFDGRWLTRCGLPGVGR